MYSKKDWARLLPEANGANNSLSYRSPYRIDYSRLIHSPAFRRLQGKTQLYPSSENDFFRNRLTHSIEVAQIAKSIALKINNQFKKRIQNKLQIDTDLVEFASLAHDIGHPPFGHQGEEALDNLMINHGGFEGNAQTLRLLTKIEKKVRDIKTTDLDQQRFGLNLTSRSIASILKYDTIIPISKIDRIDYAKRHKKNKIEPVKGYYLSEEPFVQKIKDNILGSYNIPVGKFKTLECSIMDVADDISYSTYDLEDTLKAKFCHPFDIIFARKSLQSEIADIVSYKLKQKVTIENVSDILFGLFGTLFPTTKKNAPQFKNIDHYLRFGSAIAYQNAIELTSDGYLRTQFTSNLVNSFVEGIEVIVDKKCLALSEVRLTSNTRLIVEVLKRFNYEVNIMSPRLKIAAFRGKEIIEKIFITLKTDDGYLLMPDDYRDLYHNAGNEKDKYRVICDFIAGMTDRYCIEFYARLTSENPETIFKPF